MPRFVLRATRRAKPLKTSMCPTDNRARYTTWTLTLSATAAVAGGDTLRARRLVDSIESVEGAGFYVTRTEPQEIMARLFEANGQRDSAAAHYAIVERAWRSADPVLNSRYETAGLWVTHDR